MIADLEPPKPMPPNLGPGYRPPFKKGYDPRRYKGHFGHQNGITASDASRLLKKLESLVDELRGKKRNHTIRTRDSKSLKKPRLAPNHVVATRDSKVMVKPISKKAMQSTVDPDQNASQVKPEPKELPVAPVLEDDCPF